MTYEELEKLVLDKKAGWALRRALAPLDEKARSKLSRPAQKLHRQLRDRKAAPDASNRLKFHLVRGGGGYQGKDTYHARLALFALCPVSVPKKLESYAWHDLTPLFDQIIRDRRPQWLDDWVANAAGADLPFDILRGWIRDGVCAKPEVDGYYQSFASFLMHVIPYQLGAAVPSITKQLLADPPLLADIPRLFRIESGAFTSTPWVKGEGPPDYETWSDALLKLTADGNLDRAELLQAAIEGLKLDFGRAQLVGMQGFYKRMEPVQAELLLHQSCYIDLLLHPVGLVVTFALEMLAKIGDENLQVERILPELPVALLKGGKGHALLALRLLKRIISRQNQLASGGLTVIGEALRHPHPDVQSAALDILEANSTGVASEDSVVLQETEPFVAASNRARLARLLTPAVAIYGRRADAPPTADPTPSEAATPLNYHPIASDRIQPPILHPENAIRPIESVEELIEAALHAAETIDSPDEIERIIDAVSRLGTNRPADFDASVAPLLHRLKSGGGNNGLVIGTTGVGGALLDLLHTWLTGRLRRTGDWLWGYHLPDDGFVPVSAHLRAIAAHIRRGRARPLLSAPTHKGGWIDPLLWIDRLMGSRDSAAVDSMDFRLSMLRLAPDNRIAALEHAVALPAPLGRVVCFALGGDIRPTRADRALRAAWITAARCRDPFKDWSEELALLNLDDRLPDGGRAADYVWRASHRSLRQNKTWVELPDLSVTVICKRVPLSTEKPDSFIRRIAAPFRSPANDWRELPTAALTRGIDSKSEWGERTGSWVAQWLSYIWPQNPAALCMRGATKLASRIDNGSSTSSPNHGYFHALFQRGRPWREPGHLLLSLGLVGKDADACGLAIDALIEGVDNQLFDPAIFASTIARLVESGWIKLNRLGDALLPVVQVSPLHAAVVSEALQRWLPKVDLQQKNAFRLLEVLAEAQALTGKPLRKDIRILLTDVRGSGKIAKIVKQLVR